MNKQREMVNLTYTNKNRKDEIILPMPTDPFKFEVANAALTMLARILPGLTVIRWRQ